MILPDKHVKLSNSVLNLGAIILENIDEKQTVSVVWDNIRDRTEMKTFERFTLGLDFLYLLELVSFNDDGFLVKNKS